MKDINPELWAAFEAFAKLHPEDPGARMALELAQWVKEQQPEIPPASVDP